jgi:hypothetical protein
LRFPAGKSWKINENEANWAACAWMAARKAETDHKGILAIMNFGKNKRRMIGEKYENSPLIPRNLM